MISVLLARGGGCGLNGKGGRKNRETKEWVRPLWFLFSVGWYVALSLAIPTGIGFWLDRPEVFDTRPLLTLAGFAIGTVTAFYGLYRMLRQFYLEQRESEKGKNKEQTS
jgi:acyl-CoA synthetase (AMP-forming)/AMP-acid ligase II